MMKFIYILILIFFIYNCDEITNPKKVEIIDSVQGMVLSNYDSSSINGAEVSLDTIKAYTDSLGQFILKNVPSGKTVLSIQSTNYTQLDTLVNITKDSLLSFYLSPILGDYFPLSENMEQQYNFYWWDIFKFGSTEARGTMDLKIIEILSIGSAIEYNIEMELDYIYNDYEGNNSHIQESLFYTLNESNNDLKVVTDNYVMPLNEMASCINRLNILRYYPIAFGESIEKEYDNTIIINEIKLKKDHGIESLYYKYSGSSGSSKGLIMTSVSE